MTDEQTEWRCPECGDPNESGTDTTRRCDSCETVFGTLLASASEAFQLEPPTHDMTKDQQHAVDYLNKHTPWEWRTNERLGNVCHFGDYSARHANTSGELRLRDGQWRLKIRVKQEAFEPDYDRNHGGHCFVWAKAECATIEEAWSRVARKLDDAAGNVRRMSDYLETDAKDMHPGFS